ncbi:uncharacterized protein KIAA2012 homolog isoform X1 [Crotalus tigris]|uniref:uncharacterized protein KIAA2012 homolog isoform X1 n=1 Tax=Crotalus tigris TaxID=88082 RepID=UPI00192FB58D|nr:uncharacterized protein KIAA2012 homolog isoform X1 [Crotalus tigris]
MSSLSLLSRGTGQVIKKKQEKLKVHFDPQDDLNRMSSEGLCSVNRLLDHRQIMKEYWRLYLPKTYCTRRGTLFLYSEDVAKPWKWKLQQGCQNKSQTLCVDLHTLQDLARAILVYGSKQLWQDKKGIAQQPYLYFLRDSDSEMDRSMRPGYSAKRYLLKLAQSWDPNVLQKLQNAGYISDPLLFKENAAALKKKLQDLSTIPPKYNLHIFYTPSLYSQSQLKELSYSGLGPPLRKKSENRASLVKGDPEHNARGADRIPLRISVRKLSVHLQPQHSRESIWNQNEAHWQISENRGVEYHQGEKNKKEPHNCEMPNQSVKFSLMGNTGIATSEFWCEQSHVNFYGGFLPGKKITYSVNQNHLKSTASRGRGLSEDKEVFPLINPGGSKEQDEITKKHKKQVPEFFKLPQIAESSPNVQREKIKPSELSKELVILPLLVQSESPTKAKHPRGTCSKEVKSETDVCDKQSVLLLNDLVLDTKHRKKPKQTIKDGLLRASQDSFYLPLINPDKFALNDGKRRKREVSTGTDNTKQIESHKSTSLNILLTGPNGEIICPSLLRSVQTTDNPRKFELATGEEVLGEDKLSIEVRRPASRSSPEVCSEDQASNKRETIQLSVTLKNGHYAPPAYEKLEPPLTQLTQNVPRNGTGFENHEVITGNEGVSAEFGERHQPSQTGLCRKSYPQQSEEEKGYSSLSQTHSMKQRNTSDIMQDEGEQLDSSAQSINLFHYQPRLAHLKISTSEIGQAPNPEHAPIKPFDYHEEGMENLRIDLYAPETFGTEEDVITFSESTSQPAAVAHLKQAEGVLKSKRTERQKKQPIQKAGDGLKKQKKSLKKEKYQSHTEFVVGKPREKRIIRKTIAYSKGEPTVAKRSARVEEGTHERDSEQEDAEAEPISCLVEEHGEEEGGGDQSLPDSSIFMEEHPLTLDMNQTFSEEVGNTSGFHPGPASETSIATYKAVSTADGSQPDAEQGKLLLEDLSLHKEELKLSRDRIIAERAEKRRLAVETKRKEQEERKKKEQEEQERMEKMREEMEQEKQRKIEEFRLRKQQLEAERQRQEEEADRERQAEKAAQDQARRLQEEQRRRFLEMQRKKQAQELERAEAEKRRQKEMEMQLEEERRQLAEMAEEQRLEYEKRKKEEEEKMRLEAEERRRRAEEEARVALEEARKQALLLSRQMADLEKEQQFQYQLLIEASGLDRRQEISRPWVYSYFQRPFFTTEDD